MVPAVAGGKSGQVILDVLVRGLHEGDAAAECNFAASFRSWRAVSASLEVRYSTCPLCCLGLFDQMYRPLAVTHPL
ncbi:hypothetical protein [Desulfocastanea catecholica]